MTDTTASEPVPHPGNRAGPRAGDSLRLNQILGLAIVIGAVGAILWLTVVARRRCADPDLPFVAYVPGVVEVKADTRVEFYEQCVGRIAEVEPGVAALQVAVARPGPVGEQEAVTLSERDPEAVVSGGALTLRYQSPTAIALQTATEGPWTFERGGGGLWTVEGPALRDVTPSEGGLVRPGTILGFDPVQVTWSDVGRFTRIEGTLDASAFERVASNAGLSESLTEFTAALGAGTAIRVGSSIIGTSGPPRVRLVPSYTRTLLVSDRGGNREFSPEAGTNVMAFLGDAMDYLASPSKAEAPPINRYERLIDDLNGSLSEVRGAVSSARKLADTLGSVADDGGINLPGGSSLASDSSGSSRAPSPTSIPCSPRWNPVYRPSRTSLSWSTCSSTTTNQRAWTKRSTTFEACPVSCATGNRVSSHGSQGRTTGSGLTASSCGRSG